jgi:hypothetical protein
MEALTSGFQEIEDVYAAVAGRVRSIAVTSPGGATGVTTLIRVLGTRFALAGRSTLLVDLNTHRPGLGHLEAARAAALPGGGRLALHGPPDGPSQVNTLKEPGILEARLAAWYAEYDVVLMDSAPVNRMNLGNVPA